MTFEERDAFVHARLAPDEAITARSRRFGYVTDRRILLVDRFRLPPRAGEWFLTDVPFAGVYGWSVGRLHDHRPVLRLEHAPRPRVQRGPAVRILWVRLGSIESEVPSTTTTLEFSRSSDAFLVSIGRGLERAGVPAGPGFVVELPGTRAERAGGALLVARPPASVIGDAVRRALGRRG